MRTRIICPALRPGVAGLARRAPLATLPMFGSSPLGIQLSSLYERGIRDVEILAADRPEFIREHVGSGEAWGLRVFVTPVAYETRANDASLLDGANMTWDGAFQSYRTWFEALRAAFSEASDRRAGMRELSPGVCVHSRAEIAPDAKLVAPCWVGENARIGSECLIGPSAYIEDGCLIENGATIEESWVGPGTYVGPFVDILNSLAWGRWLCKWTTGTTTVVQDAFLLGEIHASVRNPKGRWFNRAAGLVVALGTCIVPVIGLFLSVVKRRSFWQKHEAVFPDGRVFEYGELLGFSGLLRRWPRLLAIAKGDFAWVGNPPLAPSEAGALLTQYERLWYSVRPGLVSLADIHGDPESRNEEAVAQASFFTASQSVHYKVGILIRAAANIFNSSRWRGNCGRASLNEDLLRGNHPSRH